MTPLAAHLSKQLVSRAKDRDPFWGANIGFLRDSLYDTHYFEFTEILPLLDDLAHSMQDKFGRYFRPQDVPIEADEFVGALSFLPAPKTWIEWKHPSGRMAFLLEESRSGVDASATIFWNDAASHMGSISLTSSDYYRRGGAIYLPGCFELCRPPNVINMDGRKIDVADALLGLPHLVLIAINSPRILGRHQLMPNRGLERRLTRSLGAGKFPLHAWTELKLRVAKPIEISDGEPHEAHLTGKRALHFCRKHVRIKNGKLEYVSSHWRGDPAVGIKQTRYAVTP